MSELSELSSERWAVISERGKEQIGVTYDEAVRAIERLRSEGVRGLNIVSDEAARRLQHDPPAAQSR